MSKILVVDDNSDIVMMLRMTFEAGGHEVLSTSDPFEAVPLMLQHVPDVLILDVMMPKRSGWDVLREVRQHARIPSIPIVMLTALADVNDRVRGLRGGADDYQVKPFEPEEILARVEGLIARRGGLPLAPPSQAEPGDGASKLEGTLAEIERRIAAQQDLDDLSLGRYEVRKPLGRGAMGTVLEGWDPKLQRSVALKTLRLSVEQTRGRSRGRQVSRLIQEAVTNARVNHPNIVTVYDVGEAGEAAFIAMEMVAGQSLDDRLDAYGALPYPYVIFLGISVARALVAAHQQGIVHRDIKPANVLLGDEGSVKVTDFGISELLTRTCAPGSIFGTPGYLAPETLTGSSITPSSDLFSLGVTLYECLIGGHPFADVNWRKTLSNTVSKNPRPLDQILSGLPPQLVQVVGQMMEKEPADRPEKADVVVDLLEKLSFTEDISIPANVKAPLEKRVRVSTTRSRMVTLETRGKTQEMDAASL